MKAVARDETEFRKQCVIVLCRIKGVRAWVQNCGLIPVRDQRGKVLRYFDAGPPTGAADISGGIAPDGFRLECELKMPGKKRSAEQISWAEFCIRMGFVYVFCTYVEVQSFAENAERLGQLVLGAIHLRREQARG